MSNQTLPFWQAKSLSEMTQSEWESLCDGCGLCCCHKRYDAKTQSVSYSVALCRFLDSENRCTVYPQRLRKVPDCVALSPEQAHFNEMPLTCAYRCLAEHRDLPDWHPLKTGVSVMNNPEAVSVRDWPVISEDWVDLEEAHQHIIMSVS